MMNCSAVFPCTRNNSGLYLSGSNIARQLSLVSPKKKLSCPVINYFIYQSSLEDSTMNLVPTSNSETELAYVQFRIRSLARYDDKHSQV